jgi:hypothetical protein
MNEKERYRRDCTHDDFFKAIASLPALKTLVMRYEVFEDRRYPYKLQNEFELLDEIEQRDHVGGAEVWYEIYGSAQGLDKVREWESDCKKMRLGGGTRWGVGARYRLR